MSQLAPSQVIRSRFYPSHIAPAKTQHFDAPPIRSHQYQPPTVLQLPNLYTYVCMYAHSEPAAPTKKTGQPPPKGGGGRRRASSRIIKGKERVRSASGPGNAKPPHCPPKPHTPGGAGGRAEGRLPTPPSTREIERGGRRRV